MSNKSLWTDKEGAVSVLISCPQGLEDVCIDEAGMLIKGYEEISPIKGGVIIKLRGRIDEVVEKAERIGEMQSARRAILICAEGIIKKAEDTGKLKIKELFIRGGRFRVTTIGGGRGFSSTYAASLAGALILKKAEEEGIKLSVSLNGYDTLFLLLFAGGRAYLGIDIFKRELSRRSYRHLMHRESLSAPIAFASFYLPFRSVGRGKHLIIDPFCGSGSTMIEGAIFISKMRGKQEKEKCTFVCLDRSYASVRAARINSKLAGVEINCLKREVEWLDTLYGKEEIDIIIAQPDSLRGNEERNSLRELFHQAEFVLNSKGRMCVVATNKKLHDECLALLGSSTLKIEEDRPVLQGKGEVRLLIIKKG